MDDADVVYPTRVDAWLVVVLGAAVLVALTSALLALRGDPAAGWVTLAGLVVTIVFVAAIAVPTEYTVTGTELIIRFGLARTRIPLDSIVRVYPTSNPLSAPAWSLTRIGIHYRVGGGRRLALISPVDREGFMELLAERTALERQGTALVRATPDT